MGAADILMRIAVLLTFLVLAGPLAGCFGDDEIIEETVIESYYPDIFDVRIWMELDWYVFNGSRRRAIHSPRCTRGIH